MSPVGISKAGIDAFINFFEKTSSTAGVDVAYYVHQAEKLNKLDSVVTDLLESLGTTDFLTAKGRLAQALRMATWALPMANNEFRVVMQLYRLILSQQRLPSLQQSARNAKEFFTSSIEDSACPFVDLRLIKAGAITGITYTDEKYLDDFNDFWNYWYKIYPFEIFWRMYGPSGVRNPLMEMHSLRDEKYEYANELYLGFYYACNVRKITTYGTDRFIDDFKDILAYKIRVGFTGFEHNEVNQTAVDEVVAAVKVAYDLLRKFPYPTIIRPLIEQKLLTNDAIGNMDKEKFIALIQSNLKEDQVSKKVAEKVWLICQPEPEEPPPPPDGKKPDPVDDSINDPANPVALTFVDPNAEPPYPPKTATVSELVGGTDLITVDDRTTTLTSPGAYFVDLLQLLKLTWARVGAGNGSAERVQLLDKLLERRPDLPFLQLSAENTNVALPYLDLANEVMVQVIKAKLGKAYTGKDQGKNYYDVRHGETTEDLMAQPVHVDYDIYNYINGAVPIGSLPYEIDLDRIRILLRALGSSLYELLTMFPHGTCTEDKHVHAEFLNITDEEVDLLLGTEANLEVMWGNPAGDILTTLADIKNEVLPRASLTITELAEMLKTEYINPGQLSTSGKYGNPKGDPIVIFDHVDKDGRPGLLPNMKLQLLDKSKLSRKELFRIQVFTRLLKRLGSDWSMTDLDNTIKLFSGENNIDINTFKRIDYTRRIVGLTGIEIPKVLACFGPMSLDLYRAMFITHDLSSIDPVFELDNQERYLANAKTLADHLPVLYAALRLSAKDFDSLLAVINKTTKTPLTLDIITSLVKGVVLRDFFEVELDELPALDSAFNILSITEPEDMFDTLQKWRRLTEESAAGELIFIASKAKSDPDKLSMERNDVLVLAVQLGQALGSIDREYADIEIVSTEIVLRYTSIFLGPQISKEITDFLEGRRVVRIAIEGEAPNYKTDKLEVSDGYLIARGLLTEKEKDAALGANRSPGWKTAIDEILQNTKEFFHITFEDFNLDEATFLQGDSEDVSKVKRTKFMENFLPYFKANLAHTAVLNSVHGIIEGLSSEIVQSLLSRVKIGDALIPFRLDSNEKQPFEGSLVPAASGEYRFIGSATGSMTVDNTVYNLEPQFAGSKTLLTQPISLKGGQSYDVKLPAGLQWRDRNCEPEAVGPLISNGSYEKLAFTLSLLSAYRKIIQKFSLNASEVSVLGELSWDLLDFLTEYTMLKDKIIREQKLSTEDASARLLALLKKLQSSTVKYSVAKVAAVTGWRADQIRPYEPFDGKTLSWADILQVDKQLVICKKLNVGINKPYGWLEDTRRAWADELTLLYNHSPLVSHRQWEERAGETYGILRDNHRKALIGYLLQQEWTKKAGVTGADGLFEYLLIDPQVGSCLETSRIKQGISTIQLYIQRCLLGVEADGTMQVEHTDEFLTLWDWMSKYTVWEANRKVFLFPENWLEPSLRDNKSAAFQKFEAELDSSEHSETSVNNAVMTFRHETYKVRSLIMAALWIDFAPNDDGSKEHHYFARSVEIPYTFYHRVYNETLRTWAPWAKIDAQITVHDHFPTGSKVDIPGSYLLPFRHKNRLYLFLPILTQRSQKSKSNVKVNPKTGSIDGSSSADKYWDIQMGYIEYRHGKWSDQKVFPRALTTSKLWDVRHFYFGVGTPQNIHKSSARKLFTDAIGENGLFINVPSAGTFLMSGGTTQVESGGEWSAAQFTNWTSGSIEFMSKVVGKDYNNIEITVGNPEFPRNAVVYNSKADHDHYDLAITKTTGMDVNFNMHNLVISEIMQVSNVDSLYGKISGYSTHLRDGSASSEWREAFGCLDSNRYLYHESRSPSSVYNWELGFHVPAMVIDKLLSTQQFDLALKYSRYIFDPRPSSDGASFWKFPPFAVKTVSDSKLDDGIINEWKHHPFQPYVIARSRALAYKKWFLMKYIEILVGYGDYYFRQATLESMPLAIQLYIEAAHIYGTKGQDAPLCGTARSSRYKSLADKSFDELSNSKVTLQYLYPFAGEDKTIDMLLGSVSSYYFKYYSNPKLVDQRTLIDDRLYKIRHCLDINGNKIKYPLFEAPIDPSALVRAAAAGISLSSALNSMDSPMANFRFRHVLKIAFDLCHQLRHIGKLYLYIRERKDAEGLMTLQAQQRSAVQELMIEAYKLEVEKREKKVELLQDKRSIPRLVLAYYGDLLGENRDGDQFQELTQTIARPDSSNELRLNGQEIAAGNWNMTSTGLKAAQEVTDGIAGAFSGIPRIHENMMPMGVGITTEADATIGVKIAKWIGKGLDAGSQIAAGYGAFLDKKVQRKFRLAERRLHFNKAGYELRHIEKEIEVAEHEVEAAKHEIEIQKQRVKIAGQEEDFLRSKWTNQQLYARMDNVFRKCYYDTYTVAYDLAKKAEKSYQFEHDDDKATYIQPGYWVSANSGLSCAEALFLDLKKLEAASLRARPYDFEITKEISLRKHDPTAFVELRKSGSAQFELTEALYDMDYPGQYSRRIKSVSINIACDSDVACTLILREHKCRITSTIKNETEYAKQLSDAFRSDQVPVQAIATSAKTGGPGVFKLDFKDERYIPFEGAGAVSHWTLQLSQFRQFDYNTIRDVAITVNYTSKPGGGLLTKAAVAAATPKEGLSVLDLEEMKGWQKFADAHETRELEITLAESIPYYARMAKSTSVILYVPGASGDGTLFSIKSDKKKSMTFRAGGTKDNLLECDVDFQDELTDKWVLTYGGQELKDNILMVVHYKL